MIGIIITTAECNLDCKYCYEHCRQRTRISRIEINKCFSEQISQINEFVSFISVSANRNDRNAQIIFHGGEPLMLNLNLLEKVLCHAQSLSNLSIQIQTNGTLITEQSAKLFKKYNVSIVISIDGYADIHDKYRVNCGRKVNHARIMQSITWLKQYEVPVSALSTITDDAKHKANEIYRFFEYNGIDFSINRCFPKRGLEKDYCAISEQNYYQFLSDLYDIYYTSKHGIISIPCFDRCVHDLKLDGLSYTYRPRISPNIWVYDVEGSQIRQVTDNTTGLSNIKYCDDLKTSVIKHLIWQQNQDFIKANGILSES